MSKARRVQKRRATRRAPKAVCSAPLPTPSRPPTHRRRAWCRSLALRPRRPPRRPQPPTRIDVPRKAASHHGAAAPRRRSQRTVRRMRRRARLVRWMGEQCVVRRRLAVHERRVGVVRGGGGDRQAGRLAERPCHLRVHVDDLVALPSHRRRRRCAEWEYGQQSFDGTRCTRDGAHAPPGTFRAAAATSTPRRSVRRASACGARGQRLA